MVGSFDTPTQVTIRSFKLASTSCPEAWLIHRTFHMRNVPDMQGIIYSAQLRTAPAAVVVVTTITLVELQLRT